MSPYEPRPPRNSLPPCSSASKRAFSSGVFQVSGKAVQEIGFEAGKGKGRQGGEAIFHDEALTGNRRPHGYTQNPTDSPIDQARHVKVIGRT
jgi:hypothetical protein